MAPRKRPPKRDLNDLAGLRLGLYCRVSVEAEGDDRATREKSVNDQETVGRDWIERRGAALADVYRDSDRSASKYATKQREEFQRLVADVEAGKLDVVWFWEQSRSSRRLSVFADLFDLCRDRGVLWVNRDSVYDPNDPTAELLLGIQSVVAANESNMTSERVRRGLASSAAAGRPPTGKTPYGYHRVYDQDTRQFVRQEPQWHDGDGQPLENTPAAIVGEIFRRVAAGESLHRLARDFNERGVVMPNGKAPGRGARGWYPIKIRQLALNPAYIAKRVHQGEILADVEAQWPPLVDEDTFWAVHRILTDPSRVHARTGRAQTLLGGLVECGGCGSRMQSRIHLGKGRYVCSYCGAVTISREVLDGYVEEVMVRWLSDPDVFAELTHVDDSVAGAQARADGAQARAELDEWRQAVERGDISLATAVAAEKGLLARIADADERAKASTVPSVLVDQVGPQAEAAWQRANIDIQRQIIKLVAEITVKPHPVPGRGGHRRWVDPYVAERVEWRLLIGPGAGEVITAPPPKLRLGGADRRMLVDLAGHGGSMLRKDLGPSSQKTKGIRRLVERGWVTRELDRRNGGTGRPGYLVTITGAGRQALVDAGVNGDGR